MPVSVDTFYPWVAQKALALGAHIINDVSGFPDEMMEAVAGTGCGCVVMCPTGSVPDIFAHVKGFFLERLCLDPGIGFGKTMEENLALIAQVGRTSLPGCAYLMAASRKRVTGYPCGSPPFEERLPATLAAHTTALLGGAGLLRVHDVAPAVQAARMADCLRRAGAAAPAPC